MSGFFGVASKGNCVTDLFFGTDYHSHLGTRRGGMAVYGEEAGFSRSIHNIENIPFRSKFEKDLDRLEGNFGIGCISDYEGQPVLVRSHHGTYAITTVSKINNADKLASEIIEKKAHFFEMTNGEINSTELVATLINQKENLIEGIKYALETVDGSLSLMILTPKGIYAARDNYGRTPIVIGRKDTGICASFESFAGVNLGYTPVYELKAGEIVVIDADGFKPLFSPNNKMRMCTFLWVYYGYPAASYEGVSVEQMRYNCGKLLARRDNVEVDTVAGVPDSGTAHAVGYATERGIPFSRPFIKYSPTWSRSFMPTNQKVRNHVAHMKLIPVHDLIKGKRLLLIDDSIVRGTQLRETTAFLYASGAKEVHIRPACPPILFGCKYLNFSRSSSEMELIGRVVIQELEGKPATAGIVKEYTDPDSEKYQKMVDGICRKLNFTSLRFHRLDDMLEAVDIGRDKLCTYCWDGNE